MTKLDDAEGIHLAVLLQLAVVEVSHDSLHRVALVSRACAIAGEGSFCRAVCVDKVWVVVCHYVHHTQSPLCSVPLTVVEVTRVKACFGERPWMMSTLFHCLVFAQVDAIEQAWVIPLPPLSFSIV